MASSSNSPCAACKFLRRKCTPECVFAPYFPPDQPQKFANVHKVFGASNVTKLLNELHPHQREDAVNSLAYEADARLRDPVYGCVGVISLLQHQLKQLQSDLTTARSELSKYINAGMAGPLLGGPSSNLGIGMGLPGTASRDHLFRDQVMEAQISTREQQMLQGLPAMSGTVPEELALHKSWNKSGISGLISYPERLLMPISCVRFLMLFFPQSFAFGKKNMKIKSFGSLRRHLLKRLYCSNIYFSLVLFPRFFLPPLQVKQLAVLYVSYFI